MRSRISRALLWCPVALLVVAVFLPSQWLGAALGVLPAIGAIGFIPVFYGAVGLFAFVAGWHVARHGSGRPRASAWAGASVAAVVAILIPAILSLLSFLLPVNGPRLEILGAGAKLFCILGPFGAAVGWLGGLTSRRKALHRAT